MRFIAPYYTIEWNRGLKYSTWASFKNTLNYDIAPGLKSSNRLFANNGYLYELHLNVRRIFYYNGCQTNDLTNMRPFRFFFSRNHKRSLYVVVDPVFRIIIMSQLNHVVVTLIVFLNRDIHFSHNFFR